MTPVLTGFRGLTIAPQLLEVLDRAKYTEPTPIQEKAIPPAIEGTDVMGIAQTGTGKTLAFAIPMIQRIAQGIGKGLVIVPTRELALQVESVFVKMGGPLGLRTAVFIGGASMERQLQMIRKNPHVIIATPGRLIDHMEQKTVSLDAVRILVLDEADRMLDMGFAPQLKRILEKVPTERQTMVFSATMPDDIVSMVTKHMKLPVRVEIARAGTAADRVVQELFFVARHEKNRLLDKVISECKGSVLVFSRTKFGAKRICTAVRAMGYTTIEIHSNRSLAQRQEAMQGFRSGKYRVMVATDVASRGIDVTGIELVVNYDLPDNPHDYVHRIGRTGRAGKEGRAISFATPDQRTEVRDIERTIRSQLSVTPIPVLPPEKMAVHREEETRRPFSRAPQKRRTPQRSERSRYRSW